MYYFLIKNNLIYEKQFGFRVKHSVNHALISTTELIKEKLNEVTLLLEFSNLIWLIMILIHKLAYYGFRGVTQKLIKSFLTNQIQCVSKWF